MKKLIFALIAFGALIAPFSQVTHIHSVNFLSLIIAPEQLKVFYFSIILMPLLILWTLQQGFNTSFSIIKTNFYYPIIGFLLYCVWTLSYAAHLESAIDLTLQYTLMAIVFFLILNIIKHKTDIIDFFNTLIFVAVIASIIALLQYYFYDNEIIQRLFRQAVAPAATFGNKNMLVHFLVLTLPLSIGLAVFSHKTKLIVFYTLASVIIALIMVHSQTRAGWVAASLQITLLITFLIIDNKYHQSNPFQSSRSLASATKAPEALLHRSKASGKIVILLAGFVVWLVLINYTQQGWEWNFGNIAGRIDTTIEQQNGRIPAWTNTLEMIKNNPWFGVGLGGWQHEYALYYDRILPDVIYNENVRLERLHNDYLELFANLGLVGFSILIILLIMIIKAFYQLLKHRNTKIRQINIMLILALIGFSISAFFSFPLRVFFPGVIVMSFIAILVYLSNSSQPFKLSFSFGKLLIVPLIMLSFMFSWSGFNRIMSSHYDSLSEQLSTMGARTDAFFASLKALSYDPTNYQTLFSLARTSFQIGKTDKAIELLEQVHDLNPKFDQPLLALALAYAKKQQNQKAIKTLKKLLIIDPKKVKAHAMITRIYVKQKDLKNAQKHHTLMLQWQTYFKGRKGFSANQSIIKKTTQILEKSIK